jgi:glycosyltransferase involved in cell wall biosynthesis
MSRISAVIIARNEEHNIERCLRSLAFCDEIIVVDSGSVDRTADIARDNKATVLHHDFVGYGPAKQRGVEAASGDWILSIDADEAVSPILAEEIRATIGLPDPCHGYLVPRCTNFLGRWIRHSNWYPDYVLRLFQRSRGRFDGAVVHEKVMVEGPVGRLRADLLHYSYPTMEEYLRKFDIYTTMGAEEALKAGKRAGWFSLTVRPLAAFLRHYIIQQGFRDGQEGFLISVLSSGAVMVKYAKLRQLCKNTGRTTNG